MRDALINKANEIISILKEIPVVKGGQYGSLSTNTYDELSDIDIEVDVSGSDYGQTKIPTTKNTPRKTVDFLHKTQPKSL